MKAGHLHHRRLKCKSSKLHSSRNLCWKDGRSCCVTMGLKTAQKSRNRSFHFEKKQLYSLEEIRLKCANFSEILELPPANKFIHHPVTQRILFFFKWRKKKKKISRINRSGLLLHLGFFLIWIDLSCVEAGFLLFSCARARASSILIARLSAAAALDQAFFFGWWGGGPYHRFVKKSLMIVCHWTKESLAIHSPILWEIVARDTYRSQKQDKSVKCRPSDKKGGNFKLQPLNTIGLFRPKKRKFFPPKNHLAIFSWFVQ